MIVGIDLGTTNSLVAIWDGEAPRLIPNALGEVLTPSCVSLDEDGTVLVGRAARERLQSHPERTAAVFKRYMGTDRTLRLGEREFRSEELSALVLRALKEDAEAHLGQPVTRAIITVPAYFSDAQRKATRAAAQLAGLDVDRLLNEPTAAALAYGIHKRGEETRFLVFDLGGGTFDVSVLDLFEGVMEVRASAGDNFLGGEDFVQALVEHLFPKAGFPARLRKDAAFMQHLGAQVELLKRALSASPSAAVKVAHDGKEYLLEIQEEELERICEPLLQRLRDPVERALRDSGMQGDDLDAVVLAGGATRMPVVRRLVARMFGRPPACELNPDEVVALGAAVQAGLRMKDAALDEVVMTDVAPYSLGVEVTKEVDDAYLDGHFDPVIERNSAIPISRVRRYFPLRDGQRRLELRVYQGEGRMVKDNILLGRLDLDLPYAPRSECGVDVRFTYDVNGLLEVQTTLVKTGAQARIVIQGNPGLLTEAEIEARLASLAALKIHPRDRMENRTVMARLDRLYQLLRGPERERLDEEILRYERAIESQDDRLIAQARKRAEEVAEYIESAAIFGSGPVQ